jgi:hypothetical protein
VSLLGEDAAVEKAPFGKQAAVVLGSLAATALLVLLALWLGSWALGAREGTLHAGRLERLLKQHPPGESVRAGLEGEGARLLGEAGPAGLTALARRVTPSAETAVVARGGRASRARAFLVGRYVYWLFFDANDRLVGFLLVAAP